MLTQVLMECFDNIKQQIPDQLYLDLMDISKEVYELSNGRSKICADLGNTSMWVFCNETTLNFNIMIRNITNNYFKIIFDYDKNYVVHITSGRGIKDRIIFRSLDTITLVDYSINTEYTFQIPIDFGNYAYLRSYKLIDNIWHLVDYQNKIILPNYTDTGYDSD